MIEVRNLTKHFNGMTVLKGINLDIKDNDTLVILGPSGQGKTVFIKSLVRLVEPDSGIVRYDGVDVLSMPKRKFIAFQKKIAFVFQDNALFDYLNVRDNLSLYLRMHSQLSEEEIFQEVLNAVQFVRLDRGVLDKFPEELSGGMMKRIAIARAMVQQPCYIFYDEPTMGLDEANVEMVVELIHKFKKRVCATAVIVTHDIHLMRAVSDRVVLLKEGQIEFVGSKEEITENALHTLYRTGVEDV